MIESVILFTITWMISYFIVCGKISTDFNISPNADICVENKKNIKILAVIAISALFTLYNYYVTTSVPNMGSDRLNYLANFVGMRDSSSIGLSCMMKLVHFFNGDIYTLFYLTTFICVFLTLMAYRESKDASRNALLLVFLSQYILVTFTALKQSFASAFASLFLVYLFEKKNSNLICALLIAGSILFHPAGCILVPIFFMIKLNKNKTNVILYFIGVVVITLFFEKTLVLLANLLNPIIPFLSNKIFSYFGENAYVFADSSVMAFIKGFPYYLITFIGVAERTRLGNTIKNYDNYLIISITVSFLYLMTFFNQWMARFQYLFILNVFTFLFLIIKNMPNKNDATILKWVEYASCGFITYRFLYLIYALSGAF